MEKLNKVIAGLTVCISDDHHCTGCPHEGLEGWCDDALMKDALDLLRDYRNLLTEGRYHRGDSSQGDLISRSALLAEFPVNLDSPMWHVTGVRAVISATDAVEAEPVVHAHWITRVEETWHLCELVPMEHHYCSACGTRSHKSKRCPECGAHMDELRTCYCPLCDKHFEVHSNDSHGTCPDCGHHVVLHREEVADG